MGLWIFLTVVVLGNMALKAYKLRMRAEEFRVQDEATKDLAQEVDALKAKIKLLEETVFLDDFELKREFSKLEKDMASRRECTESLQG